MDTAEKRINIAQRIVLIVMTALFIIGIGLFDYACYAAEECKDIDSYFPPEENQVTCAVDRAQ